MKYSEYDAEHDDEVSDSICLDALVVVNMWCCNIYKNILMFFIISEVIFSVYTYLKEEIFYCILMSLIAKRISSWLEPYTSCIYTHIKH